MSYFSWDSSRIIALVVFLAVSLVGAKREIDEFFYDNLYASKEMITQAHVPEETHPQEQEQRQQQQQMTRRIKAQMRANHGTSLLQTNDEHTMPVHWQNMINAAQLAVERKVVSFKVDQEQKNKAAIAAAKAHAKAESMSKAQEIQNKISLMQKQIQIEKKKVKKMQSFIQIRDQQKKAVAKVQAKSKALQVSEKDKIHEQAQSYSEAHLRYFGLELVFRTLGVSLQRQELPRLKIGSRIGMREDRWPFANPGCQGVCREPPRISQSRVCLG